MCNEDFVDTNVVELENGSIKVAYFPFMDHNPGPVYKVFKLAMDMVLNLAMD